ncbi:sialate O-acetylesterase [Pontibacter harenae]|uniref:sialate O-acetylesterase n=1 Tax=Pontibacter harenae TaxID=2894083 RepID=UPI001E500926|nr:sialate O-acetylesterase [Pontibacter harenae]MCC9167016.1 sialate O-acetylesterase [Pontibacter harenae]
MKATYLLSLLIPVLALFNTQEASANVQLPAIFGDHMVLQQNAEVTMWGWAKSGEEVIVTPSWNQQPIKTKASNQAKWEVKLQTPAAGGPYSIKIQGYNTLMINDVLLGEVWLCSGQSNMEWSARAGIDNAEQHVAQANYPSIRFFSVAHRTADAPQLDLGGEWVVCTPETMVDFSAIGYFFGREVNQNLKVPVGLINSSWGGTPAEIWMNPKAITENKTLVEDAANLEEVEWGPVQPGRAFHAMISPLIPYRIAGALWYQGESNTGSPENYAELLPALINNWRNEWKDNFPFYFVQIAPYNYGDNFSGVLLRDAQRKVLDKTENTGMVVISDIGNPDNIHPTNKHDVGLRLANLALNKTYGKKEKPAGGPLFRDMKVEGNKVRLHFDNADKGLVARGKKLTEFEVAGEDQKFVPATAKVVGNTVVVQAKSIKKPVAVRYAWSNTANPNLFNKDGLPASSFSTSNESKK